MDNQKVSASCAACCSLECIIVRVSISMLHLLCVCCWYHSNNIIDWKCICFAWLINSTWHHTPHIMIMLIVLSYIQIFEYILQRECALFTSNFMKISIFKIGVNPSKSFLKSILGGKMLIYIYECIFIVNHFRFVIDKAYISKILSYASIENEDDGTCLNSGTQKVKELLYILAPRKS